MRAASAEDFAGADRADAPRGPTARHPRGKDATGRTDPGQTDEPTLTTPRVLGFQAPAVGRRLVPNSCVMDEPPTRMTCACTGAAYPRWSGYVNIHPNTTTTFVQDYTRKAQSSSPRGPARQWRLGPGSPPGPPGRGRRRRPGGPGPPPAPFLCH